MRTTVKISPFAVVVIIIVAVKKKKKAAPALTDMPEKTEKAA